MIGIILYEAADILYHVSKIGYNCVQYSVGLLYGAGNEHERHHEQYRVEYVELYRKRLEALEKKFEELVAEKQAQNLSHVNVQTNDQSEITTE